MTWKYVVCYVQYWSHASKATINEAIGKTLVGSSKSTDEKETERKKQEVADDLRVCILNFLL